MVGTLEGELVKRGAIEDPKVVKIRPDQEQPPLSDLDRTVIGRAAVRIDLPFVDSYKAREMGEMLIGLGEWLKAQSHRNALSERERLYLMASTARDTANRIRLLHGRLNKNGTIKKSKD